MDTSHQKIKVLVVDDSAFMRKVISDILSSDDHIEVIGTAKNGKDGIEKAQLLKPQVITLDVEMPVMDGITALSKLLKLDPEPKVIMLSSLTNNGGEATIKALEAGAIDFVPKPTSSIIHFNIDDIKDDLIKKIKSAITSNSFNYTERSTIPIRQKSEKKDRTQSQSNLKYIIAIGTSTGGPRALQQVIPYLPANIPAAVLIVQHMPPGFTKSLAMRLDGLSEINVKEAENGDVLKPGCAYLAPGDYHMFVHEASGEYHIGINQEIPMTGHRPSVNYMMNSVAACGHKNLIAVIMTGMGTDGSIGIGNIKAAGGKTVAQDEETCVVFGMPKAAVTAGVIDKIVPLNDIAKEITKFTGV
ncbi:MAG TPA: chemotaxis response regulator protein-glutamate methylesterase [Patescibacteria group bacterium]|nr:chemotaxis response regulator protein-glutamate methylesterase [Patescibacteria group bacterium]